MQAVDDRQWWTANLGSSDIQSWAAHSTNKQAIYSAVPAGLCWILHSAIAVIKNICLL